MQYLSQPSHFWDVVLAVEFILESSSKSTGLVQQHCTTQWIIHSYLIQMTQQIIVEAKPTNGLEQEIVITLSVCFFLNYYYYFIIIVEHCW